MAYLGIVPAITVIESNPGDILWKTVDITAINTTVNIVFNTEGPKEMYVAVTMTGDQTGFAFGPDIEWIGGSFPGYTPSSTEIWKFLTPDGETIYGTKLS